jgi:hypothetical protein
MFSFFFSSQFFTGWAWGKLPLPSFRQPMAPAPAGADAVVGAVAGAPAAAGPGSDEALLTSDQWHIAIAAIMHNPAKREGFLIPVSLDQLAILFALADATMFATADTKV